MKQYGWMLFFTKRPEGIEALPRKERADALRVHYQRCFEQLESLLVEGVRITSRQEFIGSVCIDGPHEACMGLKAKVESVGLATMVPNIECVRPAAATVSQS